MKRDYYEPHQAGSIMKLLWKAAGGDKYILERTTYSDQVKYACLGGIIVATGGIAALAGGYAFYTIFSPKGSALIDKIHYPTVILSMFFGCIWGLIIFNIDRFIVTSAGKGDGTEKITWEEIKGAIPRIIMGAIIALTISKPIEIRIFETEIKSALYEEQLILQKDFEIRTRKTFEDRLKDLYNENGEIQVRIDDYLRKITIKDSLYNIETANGQGGRIAGEGPVAIALKNERDRLKVEMENFAAMNKDKTDDIANRRKQINAELTAALSNNKVVSDGLDGLLERIKLSHKVAAKNQDGSYGTPWVSYFITLLFLVIELTPIFFKLMLTKTPYDYLTENRDDLIKAENGIEVKYDYYKEKDGLERHLVKNHSAEKLIYEKRLLATAEKIINRYAIQKYIDQEKHKIDNEPNLGGYIQSKDNND